MQKPNRTLLIKNMTKAGLKQPQSELTDNLDTILELINDKIQDL